jgi:hypothetical protein
MLNALFVVLWLLQPIVWHLLLRMAGLSWMKFSIPATLAGFAMIFQYVGLPALYFGWDEYRAEFVRDNELMVKVFLLSSFSISALLCGFVFGKGLFGRLSFHSRVVLRDYGIQREFIYLAVLFSIGMIFFARYIAQLGLQNVPFMIAAGLVEEGSSLEALRSSATNAFEGKYHWYRLFMIDIVAFVCYSLYARYLADKSRRRLVVFVLSVAVALFTSVMSTEKAPVLFLLIGLAMTHALVSSTGSYHPKGTFYGIAVLGLLASALYMAFMGSSDVMTGLGHVASRVFTGAIQPLYHYLEVFPEREGFLLGRSFPNPLGILPFDQYYLTVEMMNIIYPSGRQEGIVGSMPTAFWGEMYANFGSFVSVLAAAVVGFIVYAISAWLNRLSKYPITIGGAVWLALHFKDLAVTSLSGYLVDIYLWSVVILMVLGVWLIRPPSAIPYRAENTGARDHGI